MPKRDLARIGDQQVEAEDGERVGAGERELVDAETADQERQRAGGDEEAQHSDEAPGAGGGALGRPGQHGMAVVARHWSVSLPS